MRRSPTTPQNVRRRFHKMGAFARLSGRPERYMRRETAMRVTALIDEGRLQEAATLLDGVLLGLETARGDEPGFAPGLSDIQASRLAETQTRPSTPQLGAPILIPLAEPKLVSAPEAAPKGSSGLWQLVLATAGLILLTAGLVPGVIAWRSRKKEETAPAKPEAALTDKYAVERLISSGGMGEVYEGRDLKLGRRVALKKMLPGLKLDPALRKQFLQEARTVAKLTHPYIVQIHDCLESGEDVYLVFEYVKGHTLAEILTERPRLPLRECRRIFSQVCAAIEHAHKNHVLHRDLKPANIMIDENGIARVMDFGIALESTRTLTSSGPGHLDASGTLRYMPPEQHHGKSVRASDVYSMGVCLYEMTTGTLPFAADSVAELIAQKRARRYPAPSTLVLGLTQEFDLLVNAALAPDPQDRVGSAREFLELLEGIA